MSCRNLKLSTDTSHVHETPISAHVENNILTLKTSALCLHRLSEHRVTVLPRDAMHKRGLCRHAVSVYHNPSVRPSVCHVRGSCQNE